MARKKEVVAELEGTAARVKTLEAALAKAIRERAAFERQAASLTVERDVALQDALDAVSRVQRVVSVKEGQPLSLDAVIDWAEEQRKAAEESVGHFWLRARAALEGVKAKI